MLLFWDRLSVSKTIIPDAQELDRDEEKIYAYLLSDSSRDSGLDIDLDGAGVNYNSIWSDGTTMYVVENTGGSASRDPQIHKLPLPAQSETVVWEATLALAVADTPWSTVGNTNEGYGSSASPLLSGNPWDPESRLVHRRVDHPHRRATGMSLCVAWVWR